jgi:hypothetical protein
MKVEAAPFWNPYKLRKPVIKPVIKAFDWAHLIRGTLPQFAKDSRKALSRLSDGLGILGLPSKGRKLGQSFTLAYAGSTIAEKVNGSVGVLSTSASIAGVGAGAVELLDEAGVISLTPYQLLIINIFGFICSCILVLKSIVDIKNTFTVITQLEAWSPEYNSNLLLLAKKTCRLVIGIFGMALFGGVSISPYILLGASSLSLSLSLTKFYYKEAIPKL